MFSNGFDSLKARAEFYEALNKVTGVRRSRDYSEFSSMFKKPENKSNNESEGDTTMKDEETLYIKKEVDAIAHKVVAHTVRKMVRMTSEDLGSFEDVMALTAAVSYALQRSTFDVHITVQPREGGMHVKTTVKGSVSDVQGDDD